MELTVKSSMNTQTSIKIVSLAMVLWFSAFAVNRFIIPALFAVEKPHDHVVNQGIYFFPMLGLAFSVLRLDTMPFWKNMLIAVSLTLLSTFVASLFSL